MSCRKRCARAPKRSDRVGRLGLVLFLSLAWLPSALASKCCPANAHCLIGLEVFPYCSTGYSCPGCPGALTCCDEAGQCSACLPTPSPTSSASPTGSPSSTPSPTSTPVASCTPRSRLITIDRLSKTKNYAYNLSEDGCGGSGGFGDLIVDHLRFPLPAPNVVLGTNNLLTKVQEKVVNRWFDRITVTPTSTPSVTPTVTPSFTPSPGCSPHSPAPGTCDMFCDPQFNFEPCPSGSRLTGGCAPGPLDPAPLCRCMPCDGSPFPTIWPVISTDCNDVGGRCGAVSDCDTAGGEYLAPSTQCGPFPYGCCRR